MKDKSKKKIIIAIIVLIIAIIGVLIVIKEVNKDIITEDIEYEPNIVINNKLERVNIRSNYYIIKNIVEKYYYCLCNLNETSDDVLFFEDEEEIGNLEEEIAKEIENTKKRIYGFFDEDYIKETGLSTDNIQEKLGDYKDLYVFIKDMYVRDVSDRLKVYFAFGSITEKQNMETEEFLLMIVTDEVNRTFNIYTSDFISNNNLYELSKKENFNEKTLKFSKINNRTYNKYQYESVDDEKYVKDLLKSYTLPIKYGNIDYSYDRLDEEYKSKRFIEKTDYENYIEENKKNITLATLKHYKVAKYNGYKQYICEDKLGRFYIFNEKATMNYDLILDTYTVDLPEFIQKYNTATTQEKVMLNIQKVVEALNEKDYKYVYSKLADEFKENYFKSFEDFEKYAKETFDVGNEVKYINYTETKNYCTYKIQIIGENKNITNTIIMKLGEGTNFVMSFNVN